MARPARPAPLQRPLRGALAVLVLAGYLAALAATPTGQGLGLLTHLAADHAGAPLAAPALVVGSAADALPVVPTLRPDRVRPETHWHRGGEAHRHGSEAGHTHGRRPSVFAVHVHAAPPMAGDARAGRSAEAFHEHDGALHTHTAPPPKPAVVQTVSLDKHRLPEAPPVPAAPPPTDVHYGRDGERLASVSLSVETPPPIGRGDRAS